DKLDRRTFREQAILLTDLAVRLTDDEFSAERVDESAIATALEEQDLAKGMKVIGEWPFE
ncbi:MAG: peptidase M28, partial [Halobacteriaceae archaeon]